VKVLESNSRVGVLVVSGLGQDSPEVQEILSMGVPFLQKPFTKEDVLRVVLDHFGPPPTREAS